MNKDLLDSFFNKNIENRLNEEMLNRNYAFPVDNVLNYIYDLCNVDLKEYIDFIYNLDYVEQVLPRNIFQFSSFEDCTVKICESLLKRGDEGYRFDEIGKMLLDDGIERKIGALRKYGENATKTAAELGLTQIIENYTFLTCYGYVYSMIDKSKLTKFTSLLILRSIFFTNLIRESKNGKYNIHLLLLSLGESTQKRRISNIKYLIKYLRTNDSIELNRSLDKIIIN